MAISVPPEPGGPVPIRRGEALADAELVAAVRSGSDPAFEQLYGRYHRRIAAHVYGMVGDHGRAEDITQEVFMSALRRMRSTDRPIAFKPWIYEIAKNACIDQYRRSRRTDEISYDAEDGAGAAARGRLATTGPSPHTQVDQKATIENLRGALGGLSPTHHEILVLREFEGLSYREIGTRLDLSRASVESTLFRARRRLTEEYEELVTGERCLRVQGLIETAEVSAPGVRDQRRLRAHLSHCQPCRRRARHAGLDDALFVAPRGIRTKVAAFFPLPAFLQRRWGADPSVPLVSGGRGSQLAQFSAQYGANLDPAMGSWVKAAAAAVTLAVAGVAGGHAVSDQSREYFGGATPERVSPPPQKTVAKPGSRSTPRSATGAVTPAARGKDAASRAARRQAAKLPAARPPRARAANGGVRGPASSGAPAAPAAPVAPAATPDRVVKAPIAVPAAPKAPVAPGAATGTAKDTGEKAVVGTGAIVGGATTAGEELVQGVTEPGREATGKNAPEVPAAPQVPAAPDVPVLGG